MASSQKRRHCLRSRQRVDFGRPAAVNSVRVQGSRLDRFRVVVRRRHVQTNPGSGACLMPTHHRAQLRSCVESDAGREESERPAGRPVRLSGMVPMNSGWWRRVGGSDELARTRQDCVRAPSIDCRLVSKSCAATSSAFLTE